MAMLYKARGIGDHGIGIDSREPIRPTNGTDFKLEELVQLLGCDMIEVLPLVDGLIMIIDEEGKKLKDAPLLLVNARATELMQAAGRLLPGNYIVGPALVCGEQELRGLDYVAW